MRSPPKAGRSEDTFSLGCPWLSTTPICQQTLQGRAILDSIRALERVISENTSTCCAILRQNCTNCILLRLKDLFFANVELQNVKKYFTAETVYFLAPHEYFDA